MRSACNVSFWYLGSVVVHGQHAEHVQSVAALDKLAHGAGQDAPSALVRRRQLIAGRAGQLVHADDTVLDKKRFTDGKTRWRLSAQLL